MKPYLLYILLLSNMHLISAQTFDVENIRLSGDDSKRITLVILSEGYQDSELSQFITDATNLTNSMFSQSPLQEYANYFNVYAIKVPSVESGADHPGTSIEPLESSINPTVPIKIVDTYFNATYDAFGKHRLLYYEIDGNSANNTKAKISSVLATNFPAYDQALILVNSSEYGGSGGEFPMIYSGYWGANVAVHELGHSLFNLKDEYYPGDILAAEAINMTQETDQNLVRWKNWLNANDIGIYQYTCNTGNCADWYKPHQNCIMEFIDKTFCSVCQEGIIEKIHSLISPIDSYTPVSNTVLNPTFPIDFQLDLIKPNPNTLESTWTLNAIDIENNVDNVSILETNLITGINTLTVTIHDSTTMLKVDNHDSFHVYTVTWTIDNASLGIDSIESETNNYNISIFPNPVNSILNFKIESSKAFNIKIDITSLDGKKINSTQISNYENQQVDISNLSQGIYLANFYSDNTLIASKKILKQ